MTDLIPGPEPEHPPRLDQLDGSRIEACQSIEEDRRENNQRAYHKTQGSASRPDDHQYDKARDGDGLDDGHGRLNEFPYDPVPVRTSREQDAREEPDKEARAYQENGCQDRQPETRRRCKMYERHSGFNRSCKQYGVIDSDRHGLPQDKPEQYYQRFNSRSALQDISPDNRNRQQGAPRLQTADRIHTKL